MSHIHNIEITNFKSIRHQKIDGCKRINVFIGYPNVGKSNVLEALSLFSINNAENNFSAFVRMADFTTLFFDGNLYEEALIQINRNHRFTVKAENDELLFFEELEREDVLNPDDSFFVEDDVVKTTIKGKSFRIKDNKNELDAFSESSIEKRHQALEIKRYDFQKNANYSGEGYLQLVAPNGSNLFRILSSNPSLRQEVAELFKPYNLELLYDTRLQIFTILKYTEKGIFTIPYNLVADTLQRVIFYKTAIHSNKNCVLLFEEPEAHMFPPYIRKITADISLDEKNNQYFIATHSPYILDDFIVENQDELAVYIVDYKEGETKIHLLSDEELLEVRQYGVDLFYNLESYLQHGQSHHA